MQPHGAMPSKMKKSQKKFQGQHLKDAVSQRRRIQGKRKFNEKRSTDRKNNKEQSASRVEEGPGVKGPDDLAVRHRSCCRPTALLVQASL